MDRYQATTALPAAHLHQATAELRVQLRRQIEDGGDSTVPDWSTLRVVGPFEIFDGRGRIRFEYRGSVKSRCPQVLRLTKASAGLLPRAWAARPVPFPRPAFARP